MHRGFCLAIVGCFTAVASVPIASANANRAIPIVFTDTAVNATGCDTTLSASDLTSRCGGEIASPCPVATSNPTDCGKCYIIGTHQIAAPGGCGTTNCPVLQRSVFAQVEHVVQAAADTKFEMLFNAWEAVCPFVCKVTSGQGLCVENPKSCSDTNVVEASSQDSFIIPGSVTQNSGFEVQWRQVDCSSGQPNGKDDSADTNDLVDPERLPFVKGVKYDETTTLSCPNEDLWQQDLTTKDCGAVDFPCFAAAGPNLAGACSKCYAVEMYHPSVNDAEVCASGVCPSYTSNLHLKVVNALLERSMTFEAAQAGWQHYCPYVCNATMGSHVEVCVQDPKECKLGVLADKTVPPSLIWGQYNVLGSLASSSMPIVSLKEAQCSSPPRSSTTTPVPPRTEGSTTTSNASSCGFLLFFWVPAALVAAFLPT